MSISILQVYLLLAIQFCTLLVYLSPASLFVSSTTLSLLHVYLSPVSLSLSFPLISSDRWSRSLPSGFRLPNCLRPIFFGFPSPHFLSPKRFSLRKAKKEKKTIYKTIHMHGINYFHQNDFFLRKWKSNTSPFLWHKLFSITCENEETMQDHSHGISYYPSPKQYSLRKKWK